MSSVVLTSEQFASIMAELSSLKQMVSVKAPSPLSSESAAPVKTASSLPTESAAPVKAVLNLLEKKARKPRSPDAKPNGWILFTNRVRSTLMESGHPLGKECQQFCASLKEENADYDSWTAEKIVEKFAVWQKPEVSKMKAAGISMKKPKVDAALLTALVAAAGAGVSAATEIKVKAPRAPMTEDHKQKLKAGREAAKAKRDAEKALVAKITAARAAGEPLNPFDIFTS